MNPLEHLTNLLDAGWSVDFWPSSARSLGKYVCYITNPYAGEGERIRVTAYRNASPWEAFEQARKDLILAQRDDYRDVVRADDDWARATPQGGGGQRILDIGQDARAIAASNG